MSAILWTQADGRGRYFRGHHEGWFCADLQSVDGLDTWRVTVYLPGGVVAQQTGNRRTCEAYTAEVMERGLEGQED